MVDMAGGRGSLAAESDDEDDDSAPPRIRALPDGAEKSARKAAARSNKQSPMNDAQQQTSAVVDGNESDVDSDDDVPMDLWGL